MVDSVSDVVAIGCFLELQLFRANCYSYRLLCSEVNERVAQFIIARRYSPHPWGDGTSMHGISTIDVL